MGKHMLTEAQWQDYARDGFLHLGQVLEQQEVTALCRRADDLALGTLKNQNIQIQLDTGGVYEELPPAVHQFEQGTLLYRKIQGLETDDLYAQMMQHPTLREVCSCVYGKHAAISIFRAMIMNKPAKQGTVLPWHQDGGEVWALDRDPLVTIWIALDPASRANGCMEAIPGSHRLGLLSTVGSTVSDEDVKIHCPAERVAPLEVPSGHAILLHNWLIHRSGVNPTEQPRRAFTMCCMDARTRSTFTGNPYPIIYGSISDEPYPYVRQLRDDCAALRHSMSEAEIFAKSLQHENGLLEQSRKSAEAYALSLESELARVRRAYEHLEAHTRSLEQRDDAAVTPEARQTV